MAAIPSYSTTATASPHSGESRRAGSEGVQNAHANERQSSGAIAVREDVLELSANGLARALTESNQVKADSEGAAANSAPKPEAELSEGERKRVRELQSRDREVRAHEQAHKAAGGDLATAPSYEYEQGPDGKQYAVGGEVGIQLRPGSTPEETASNARRVRRAALAPAQPSAQDLAVAASAARAEQEALAEQAEESREEKRGDSEQSLTDTEARRASAYSESGVASAASGLLDLLA